MAQWLGNTWNIVTNIAGTLFGSIDWFRDPIDIALVAFIIYSVIKLVRDSRAEQLLKGILIFALAFLFSKLLNLQTMYHLLRTVIDSALIVLIVIFQPEIRRALEQVAHSRISPLRFLGMNDEESAQEIARWQRAISATCSALEMLQKLKMGALIVFERTTRLGEIVNTGTVVNAEPTAELIGNIFFNKAPLHDGAMILRDGTVYAAGCILPLTDNQQISRELGTRHRAGVGMSENSDALVVILSEETGVISMAVGGELKRSYSLEALRVALENGMLWDRSRRDKDGEPKPGGFLRRGKYK